MSYTLQPGTIPAKALAALALAYPDSLTEAQLLDGIGQPDFDELPNVMTLAVAMGYVVREIRHGWWHWLATAEGVASLGELTDGADKPALSPLQRMTQAAARRPSVSEAKPEAGALRPRPGKAKEPPPPAAVATPIAEPAADIKRPDIQAILADGDQAALDSIPRLADIRHVPMGTPDPIVLDFEVVNGPEHFDCALSANGVLRIEQDGQCIDVKVENARKLLRYLDRIRPEEEMA